MSRSHRAWFYPVVMTLFGVAVYALLQLGRSFHPSATLTMPANPIPTPAKLIEHSPFQQPFPLLILQVLVIVVTARISRKAAATLGQPPVIGEIAAGIILGPSLLGLVAPSAFAFLFPSSSLSTLGLLSQIGVLLFMFVVGLELNLSYVREQASTALAVSHFSIAVPFSLGVALSLLLYPVYGVPGISFQAFALFMGIAMSITAFPVLARILEDFGLSRTPLGSMALTCAAVDDVTAWTLLALVVTVVTTGGAMRLTAEMLGIAVGLVFFMIEVVRPFLDRLLYDSAVGLGPERTAIVLGVLLSSALVTEAIGLHALFGAFLAGVAMPPGQSLRLQLRERLETFSSVFLLPLFFVYTGLRTNIALLNNRLAWFTCAAIILTATLGKLGGSALAARWTGLNWKDSFVIGSLMNTRGLMELIALNLGYDMGILSREIFAMMVLMALTTTFMTGPLLRLVMPPKLATDVKGI